MIRRKAYEQRKRARYRIRKELERVQDDKMELYRKAKDDKMVSQGGGG